MASRYQDDTPLIAVKMSPAAAEALARACGWASHRATDIWDDTSMPGEKRRTAMEQYEWLSWGRTWLTNPEARIEVS
jgi:hypothetical protein